MKQPGHRKGSDVTSDLASAQGGWRRRGGCLRNGVQLSAKDDRLVASLRQPAFKHVNTKRKRGVANWFDPHQLRRGRGRGWGRGAWPFRPLLFPPVNWPCVPNSAVICPDTERPEQWMEQSDMETVKQAAERQADRQQRDRQAGSRETDRQAAQRQTDRQTGRQMHLQAEVWENS